jgi:glycopeptide antibiotics resistance protein
MFLEYLTNIYVLPLIATIIGLIIVYLYDKFEKKQYTNDIYFRLGILIYISCLATIYISKLNILQSGGSNTNTIDNYQSCIPQPNDIRSSFEQFKTGIPTF